MGREGNMGERKVGQMIGTQGWSQGHRCLISCDLLGNVRSIGRNGGGVEMCALIVYILSPGFLGDTFSWADYFMFSILQIKYPF